MKYLIVVPDGSADNPIDSLGGKTPLEAAELPCIDSLASRGEIGSATTVPEGISPGSDSANLSVMGYDPRRYLTGRSPLEAASIGVEMPESDISFRTLPVQKDTKITLLVIMLPGILQRRKLPSWYQFSMKSWLKKGFIYMLARVIASV